MNDEQKKDSDLDPTVEIGPAEMEALTELLRLRLGQKAEPGASPGL